MTNYRIADLTVSGSMFLDLGADVDGVALEPQHAGLLIGDVVIEARPEQLAELGRRLVAEFGEDRPEVIDVADLTEGDIAHLVSKSREITDDEITGRLTPGVIEGTGGFVAAWLKAGDELHCGGEVPDGTVGMRLVGDYEMWGTPAELGELGDRLAMRWNSKRVDAVSEWADSVDSNTDDLGMSRMPEALTCIDADRLALMLALYGHHAEAAQLIHCHSVVDGEGEQHEEIGALVEKDAKFGVSGDEGKALPAAEAYVRWLISTN